MTLQVEMVVRKCKLLLTGVNRAWSHEEEAPENAAKKPLARTATTMVKKGWGRIRSSVAAAQRLRALMKPIKVHTCHCL